MKGRCTCGQISYRLLDRPMFTHCCHCTWCQRETGSAFALNAMIERDLLEVTGEVEFVTLPSNSGKGQEVARCPNCRVAVWSHYAGSRRLSAFVRVGTLDDPTTCPPDVHIFTSTKLPWVVLDGTTPVFEAYYEAKTLWPADVQARFKAMRAKAAPV
jgi:hypothetical protein